MQGDAAMVETVVTLRVVGLIGSATHQAVWRAAAQSSIAVVNHLHQNIIVCSAAEYEHFDRAYLPADECDSTRVVVCASQTTTPKQAVTWLRKCADDVLELYPTAQRIEHCLRAVRDTYLRLHNSPEMLAKRKLARLTKRQMQCVVASITATCAKSAAKEIGVEVKTFEAHLTDAFPRLGVGSRAGAARVLFAAGMLKL